MSATDEVQATWKRVMWDVLAGLLATHSFPGHAVHSLSKIFKDQSLFEIGRPVTVPKLSEKW